MRFVCTGENTRTQTGEIEFQISWDEDSQIMPYCPVCQKEVDVKPVDQVEG